jgi:hypothetical protein
MRAILCILLLAAPAWGQTLIAEFTQANTNPGQGGPMPSTVNFVFDANPGPQWLDVVTPSQVGSVFTATPQVVDALRHGVLNGTWGAAVGTTAFDMSLDEWIAETFHTGAELTVFVPDFRDYYLTGMTRTVDAVELRPFGGNHWVNGGAQTIRFYGENTQPLPGDFNRNGEVDAADYVLFRNGYDTIASLPNESGLTPTIIGDEDNSFWRSMFGHSNLPQVAALGSVAVPEPSTSLLFLFASLLCLGLYVRGCAKDIEEKIEKLDWMLAELWTHEIHPDEWEKQQNL